MLDLLSITRSRPLHCLPTLAAPGLSVRWHEGFDSCPNWTPEPHDGATHASRPPELSPFRFLSFFLSSFFVSRLVLNRSRFLDRQWTCPRIVILFLGFFAWKSLIELCLWHVAAHGFITQLGLLSQAYDRSFSLKDLLGNLLETTASQGEVLAYWPGGCACDTQRLH